MPLGKVIKCDKKVEMTERGAKIHARQYLFMKRHEDRINNYVMDIGQFRGLRISDVDSRSPKHNTVAQGVALYASVQAQDQWRRIYDNPELVLRVARCRAFSNQDINPDRSRRDSPIIETMEQENYQLMGFRRFAGTRKK